ncbi:MAG: hypothetical protein KKE02_14965 [Alphaproteobacteria bacterium]|nr:hypothetical protein [Alphaproteobacteria bacterium]MBU1515113.1 hypothetical protein [Alphaproteobacteria bacterium]MBU2093471.1 hypothetical protein [Alphaproteobacteria bacterium]MBU2152319.1 hypothetical protein [Alphaproteobacteria bacterium]MBU2308133.1 hypothetical protein [Alphaproteobacteria bacterium]
MDKLVNGTPLWALAALLFLALMASREAGGWLRRRTLRNSDGEAIEHDYILNGILGLLALLVAFTFGLALDRYDARRDLVVDEANAIGTAEMRVRLLDPAQGLHLAGLYRQYAETRLKYGEALAADKPPLQRQSQALRARIEIDALAALQPVRLTPLAAMVTPAVNESLDIGVTREATHASRIPTMVLAVLAIYALVSAGVLGAALTAAGRSNRGLSGLLLALLTLAIIVILDLDRPQEGSIRISQQPLADLVAGFAATPLPVAATAPPSPAIPASPAAGGSSRP